MLCNDYKRKVESEIKHPRSIIKEMLDERIRRECESCPGKCFEREPGDAEETFMDYELKKGIG